MKICTTCGKEWPDDTKFCPNDGSTLRSAAGAADLIGSVVADRYHIVKKLGEGGMGAVYLGEHVKMGRKSAIKVMSPSMANDPDAIARFNREAANAARINHPNVCAIYDFGETKDGLIYLAMEFIEGEALTGVIEREGALPPNRASAILKQAADALQAAHDLGIVHRDLKPDNIMLAKARDGADVVKVVDFGIAKAMTGEEGQKVTKTGLVVGTPEYMSPEQLSGDKLDGRSDIYSLALVFYRMLTGTLPFQADSAQETMIKRLTDDPMPLNQAVPGANFPDRLQQVMDKALARMPSERYGSAAEFARDAVQSVAGMKQAAVDTEGATQLISAVPGGAPTAVAGKTQVSGAPLPRARTPDTPAPAAPPPTRPSRAARRPARKTPVAAIAASVAVLAVGGTVAAVMLKGRAAPSPNAADSATTGGAGVTGDTAARVATNNVPIRSGASGSQRTGGAPPTGGTPTGGTGGGPSPGGGGNPPVTQPTRSRVDSAAIDRELLEMIEAATTPATAASARTRAQAIYDDADVPPTLRAAAAFTVAQTFVAEGRNPEACRWNGLALALAPTNPQYLRFKNLASCP